LQLWNNCNLLHALSLTNVEIGTERETFFVNQLAYNHQVEYTKQGDFIIDRKYTVEVAENQKKADKLQVSRIRLSQPIISNMR